MIREPRSSWLRYMLAIVVTVIATIVSLRLRDLFQPNPFMLYFAAVALVSWYVGLGPGILVTVLGLLCVDYFFFEPYSRFAFNSADVPRLLLYGGTALFIITLSESRRRAEAAEREQRSLLEVTLGSIGDAVIATDDEGRITFINPIAAALTGWTAAEATGRAIGDVFRIVDGETRRPAEDPVATVVREGIIVRLAEQTVLLARDGREYSIDDSAAPIRDERETTIGVVLIFRDVTDGRAAERERTLLMQAEREAHGRAELDRARLEFLARASEEIGSSLDYDTTLANVARMSVPQIGDWCAIDIVEGEGVRRLAVAHVDPAKIEWAYELAKRFPYDPNAPSGVPNVIRTGKPEFFPLITEEMIRAATDDPEMLRIITEIGFTSVIYVPITVRGEVLGVITLVSAESGRRYDEADLALALELAARSGIAIDNARLYGEARAQREWLRVTLSSIGDAVIAADDAARISFMNPVAEALTGWSADEGKGRLLAEVFDIYNEETGEPVESPAVRVLREGVIVGLANHTVLRHRDGRTIPIDDSGAPIRDESGAVVGVVLSFHDVTERRRTEQEMKRSRDQLDVILRNVSDGITAQSATGGLIFANDAAARLSGYPDSETMLAADPRTILGRFEIFDENGDPLSPLDLPGRRALAGEEPAATVVRFRVVATDEERWSIVKASPVFDDEGNVLFAINIFHDVTELMLAEQAVRKRAAQHRIVATLGQEALAGMEIGALMDRACSLLNSTLGVEYCKVLELLPDESTFLIRSGSGWPEGFVGNTTVEYDLTTQAGYTVIRDEPILVEDLAAETRFAGSPVLHRFGIVSSLTVTIPGPDRPYGVLGVHSPRRRIFSSDDADFLRSAANVLAAAIVRRQAEDLLHEQREWLQVTLSSIGDAVIATDANGCVSFMNPVAETLTGWRNAEAAGEELARVFDIVNETTRLPVESPTVRVLREGVVVGLANHTMLLGRNGEETPIDDSAAPIRSTAGEILGVVLVFHDVSDRRQAQETLRLSELRFRTVIEQSPLSTQIFDVNGGHVTANHAWEELWGAPVSSLTGYNVLQDPQVERQGLLPAIRRAFAGEAQTLQPVHYDPSEIGKPGRDRWVRAFIYPVKEEDGTVREVVHVLEDVTDRIEAEQALRESEERFRSMADNAPVLIWLAGPDGGRTYFNRPWLEFTGRTPERELGAGWIEAIHPEDRDRVLRLQAEAFERRESFTAELRLLRADGAHRWILDTGVPRFNPDGGLAGYIGSAIDISDRKQAELDLEHAKSAAEAANDAKDRFLAVLSHELRTPLTPVLSALPLLEADAPDHGDFGTLIATIRRNIELEAHLIDDLLDQTRIVSGKLRLRPETVDAHELARNALGICGNDMQEKHLRLITDLDAPRHWVRADAARLQQVYWNLIQNAVKFTPEGGTITLRSLNTPAGELRIEIADTGVGIEPDLLPRIFDPFQQGEQTVTRRYGGLGLGLTISKSLVDLHGGSISVSSPGRDGGSTFVVTMAAVDPPEEGSATPEGTAGEEKTTDRKVRILLVEDHVDTSKVMKLLLERRGFDVETAHNVAAGVAAIVGGTFDLVISDIGLPDGSGLDLMREIRKLTPVKGIALSGFGMEEDIRKSLEAGFAEHLVKPVNFKSLQEAIERVLR